MSESAAVPTWGTVVLDCPDPKALADFYAAVLEWPEPQLGEPEEDGEKESQSDRQHSDGKKKSSDREPSSKKGSKKEKEEAKA